MLEEKKLEHVVLVGEEFFKLNAKNYQKFKTTNECFEYLKNLQVSENTILIKGSRGMKMEILQEVL